MDEFSEKQQMVFLTLQFLREIGLDEALHSLESDSALFFDMKYFRKNLTQGEWEEAENYLSGFTKVDENRHSWKLFFEIRKQKYLEALDKRDHAKAIDIMQNELEVFSKTDKKVFEGLSLLLTLDNIREFDGLSSFGDTKLTRNKLSAYAKILIEANPVFRNKLQFPFIEKAKLQTLISQSLDTKQERCAYKFPNLFIPTLLDNTRDQCIAVEDANKREREKERVEEGNLHLFDAHRSLNTNPDQQNVVRESKDERENGEQSSSDCSEEIIITWAQYIAGMNMYNRNAIRDSKKREGE